MQRNQQRASTVSPAPGHRKAPSRTPERRKQRAPASDAALLRAGLTPPQQITLEAMEIFLWRLAFVRRPLFQAPIPVLLDQDERCTPRCVRPASTPKSTPKWSTSGSTSPSARCIASCVACTCDGRRSTTVD
ncbi:hypothetical protein [Luteimonas suaedae]|uniref:hypothetical protein n=1 Tax=Luteimonas suaedae TaxID=2605430 RepID=UPI0011EDA037|nr:hypothetical protein [Luteimonas suaedae]